MKLFKILALFALFTTLSCAKPNKELEGSALKASTDMPGQLVKLSEKNMSELSGDEQALLSSTLADTIDFNKLRKQLCFLASLSFEKASECEDANRQCIEAVEKMAKKAPNLSTAPMKAERYFAIAKTLSDFMGTRLANTKCGADLKTLEQELMTLMQKNQISTGEVTLFTMITMQ